MPVSNLFHSVRVKDGQLFCSQSKLDFVALGAKPFVFVTVEFLSRKPFGNSPEVPIEQMGKSIEFTGL